MVKQEESKGLGIAGFVIGLFGLFVSWVPFIGLPFCVIGLALGLIQKNWRTHGISITGVALNGIWVLVQLVWIFFTFVGLASGV